jgi:hypothetical protein
VLKLNDRSIPLRERVEDFLTDVPHGTRLDIVALVAELARAANVYPTESDDASAS